MNKLLAVSALALTIAVSSAAFAKNNLGGGFNGPTAPNLKVTVAEAQKLSDDTPVILTGKIEQSLGNEKYQFRDSTGIITLEIDNDDWNGVNVKPEDTVEIQGEIDKGFTKLEVEVNSVVKK